MNNVDGLHISHVKQSQMDCHRNVMYVSVYRDCAKEEISPCLLQSDENHTVCSPNKHQVSYNINKQNQINLMVSVRKEMETKLVFI